MSPNRVEASKIIESSAPSLRMQLYVVTSTANSLDAVKQNLAEHRVRRPKCVVWSGSALDGG
jgi:hypothetical protein